MKTIELGKAPFTLNGAALFVHTSSGSLHIKTSKPKALTTAIEQAKTPIKA